MPNFVLTLREIEVEYRKMKEQRAFKVLLVLSDVVLALKTEKILTKIYSFEDITMALSKRTALSLLSEPNSYDFVICDDETAKWFPDKNYYCIHWDKDKKIINAILRRAEIND